MMKKVTYILLLLLVTLTSCDTYSKIFKSNDYDYRYEAAKSYYLDGKYVKAAAKLDGLIAKMLK